MGFKIGGLVSGAAKAIGQVAKSAIPGPVGTIISGAIQGGFAPSPSTSVVPTPALARFPAATTGPAIRFGVGLAIGGGIAEILRIARENTGRSVTSRMIRESVRVCGIDTTASTFGLTTEQVCQVAVSTGRRRARGISAADLRRTRSTIRKVGMIKKQLTALGAGRKC